MDFRDDHTTLSASPSIVRVPTPQSTSVRSVGYSAETKTLDVEFRHGSKANPTGVYSYAPVEPEEHDLILHAPSIGRAIRRLSRWAWIRCTPHTEVA